MVTAKKGTGGRIIRLEILDIMRIEAVAADLPGGVVDIKGKNGAGKSSVLESICMALGGMRLCPKEPIRRGAETGVVRIKIGPVPVGGKDEMLLVERRFWRKDGGGFGSKMEIKLVDGALAPEPQHILNALFTATAFDPLAFTMKKPKDQAEMLRDILGLDFDLIDRKHDEAYKSRAAVNSVVKQLKQRLDGMPQWDPDAPRAMASPEDLQDELTKIKVANDDNNRKRKGLEIGQSTLRAAASEASQAANVVTDLEQQLQVAKSKLEGKTTAYDQLAEAVEKGVSEIEALEDQDEQPVIDKLANLATLNQSFQENLNYKRQRSEIQVEEEKSKDITETLDGYEKERKGMVAAIKFPIKGLGFDEDDGLTMNGLPFDQSSHAEKLRVACAIGQLQNKQLKLLLVRTGSLMDEETEKILAEEAAKFGGQVIVEKVLTNGDGAGIIIEEGVQRGVDPEELREDIGAAQETEQRKTLMMDETA